MSELTQVEIESVAGAINGGCMDPMDELIKQMQPPSPEPTLPTAGGDNGALV